MALTIVSGRATKVSLGSDLSYAPTAQYGPVAVKNQLVSMRIDGKPVLFRSRTLPSISDDDQVAAAGPSTPGEFQAIAVRNLTTGVIYAQPTTMLIVAAIILIVLGIPLIAFLGFGLVFAGGGIYVLLRALKIRKATAMLAAYQPAPAMAAAT